jgi:hypothetical protein
MRREKDMDSLYGLFSVFSIFYTIVLIILFLGKGLGQVIWPIILLVCLSQTSVFEINPTTEMFIINETLIPMWIFHPMNFLGGLILALIISISVKRQIRNNQNKRLG